eukprot:Hpha_TRINITY_DN16035_c5_g1::TRINITY_DN16035_c5_g1_i1::g.120423::m.120423
MPMAARGERGEPDFDKLSVEFRERCRKEVEQEVVLRMSSSQPLPKPAQDAKCPVCFDMMLPPDASPMLCVPCGHTFCDRCLARLQRHGSGKRFQCPVCRAAVESVAPNHSLRSMLESMASTRGRTPGSQLAPSLEDLIHTQVEESKQEQVRQYLAAFALADARDRVVAAEEEAAGEQHAEAVKQVGVEKGVVEYLGAEESALQEQLEKLSRELAVVSSQLHERKEALRDAEERATDCEERLQQLRSHRANIGQECLKARAIVNHLAPSLDLSKV